MKLLEGMEARFVADPHNKNVTHMQIVFSQAFLKEIKRLKLQERRNAGLWREMQNRANSVARKLLLGPNRKFVKREMRRSEAFLSLMNYGPSRLEKAWPELKKLDALKGESV